MHLLDTPPDLQILVLLLRLSHDGLVIGALQGSVLTSQLAGLVLAAIARQPHHKVLDVHLDGLGVDGLRLLRLHLLHLLELEDRPRVEQRGERVLVGACWPGRSCPCPSADTSLPTEWVKDLDTWLSSLSGWAMLPFPCSCLCLCQQLQVLLRPLGPLAVGSPFRSAPARHTPSSWLLLPC